VISADCWGADPFAMARTRRKLVQHRSESTTGSAAHDKLIKLLDDWQTKKIVVAGDFMLDRYVYGNADRLSPDAPVPVLAAQHTTQEPGGASNVCLDLVALQCKVVCLGLVGRDEDGKLLRQALRDAGCNVSGILSVADRPTTVKHNFVGLAQHRHPQKMFRVDAESTAPVDSKSIAWLIRQASRLLKGATVLCLEDYNKGMLNELLCQTLIKLAGRMRVPVLVDPAAIRDYSKYRGATCITPNRTEAAQAMGVDFDDMVKPASICKMADRLRAQLRLQAVVLTLDKQGLLLSRIRQKPKHVPTKARSVYDVTGAGDMVLAMLAAAMANGSGWDVAVELANIAAGLEVERFGPVPVGLDEVLLTLLAERHQDLGKCRVPAQLLVELAAHRKQDRRIVFTNGCFDILHTGHVALFRQARAYGDLLVVGINSDESIRRIKGEKRPVNHLNDRVMILGELESVGYVVVFDEDTPIKLIRAIRPDVLVKGAAYGRRGVVGADFVASYGGEVRLVKHVKGRSTTTLIQKIEQNSV